MKKFLIILCLALYPFSCFAREPFLKFEIDAEKNANSHNNMGLIYVQDRYYAAAIKEFQTAILLCPDKQSSAIYYTNLANVYMKIGYPALAQDTLERAIRLYPMNFSYYQDVVQAYKQQGLLESKLKQYENDIKNPMSEIFVGLILIELGRVREGLSTLHEFCLIEPDLIISRGVMNYIKTNSNVRM